MYVNKLKKIKFYSSFLLILLFLFITFPKISAQTERETRAVWVATNFRLDWPPPTFDQTKQKQALIDIFDDVKSKNLNTVFFQAGINGTVLFKSSFDPYSPYITGEVDHEGTYDPLQFAIEQAHKRGLEIHAWINCIRCFSGTELNILNNPNHISKRKPEWVIEDVRDGQKSYWLDPGLPEVREYLSDMIAEMVEKYDVDGVHLDFLRYPGKNFEDEFSYSVHGTGLSRDEYRRKNITDLVELINKKIKALKPFVKLGVAPIGIFKNENGITGWEGYSEVYQDSREWLKRGLVDYLAPQIYWGFDDSPRFGSVAKEWTENSFGRSIILGIGAYKPNVKSEINSMIQYARTINAGGVAFFRYQNIKDIEFDSFQYKTYPAAMSWLDGIYPDPPTELNFKKSEINKNLFSLSWNFQKMKSQSDSVRYFALYSLPNSNSELLPDYLFDVISADRTSVTLAIDRPRRVNYYYTLKSVSKLWNESIESSNVIEIKFSELSSLAQLDDILTKPVLLKDQSGNSNILLYTKEKEKIEIIGTKGKENEIILTENVLPGKNILSLGKNLSGYQSLKITFKSSNREVELKL
ncbi:MAG: family 10 glycosylhydrolase [Ignavibacteriales bacterium]|nr:family 10 glycosylhydrolase [Ignavibacteriales bacterium]